MNNKAKIGLAVSTIIMAIAIVMIGPMDIFTHGFFYNEINCGQIAPEDFQDSIKLENGFYEMAFVPQKRHMVGFEIYLTNQPDGNSGTLHLTIIDKDGDEADDIFVDLSKVHEARWYKVRTSANLRKGEKYTLRFSAEDCGTIPYLQNVGSSYLPAETVDGNILLVYAYAEPTFTFQNKVIIILFMVAVWGFVCTFFVAGKKKLCLRIVTAGVLMTAVLTWNYMYNSMDYQNSTFSDFQADSETLVTGVIYAQQDGIYFREESEKGFGLGRYYDLKGGLLSYESSYITDDNWLDGYSRTKAAIIVNSNVYSKEVAVVGHYIAFGNGETFRIINVEEDGSNLIISLDADEVFTAAKYGSLDNAVFYDWNYRQMAKSQVTTYRSQYGLQGKVFRHLARFLENHQIIENLNLLCSMAAAFIFVVIVMLVAAKYNKVLAGVFFITFWLSPWIVNFARNLYWVEFTWFIPMAVGLFCAWKIDCRRCRVISYAAAFLAIFAKSLCGYEYISAVMMGLIAFLLADFLPAAVKKDKQKAKLLFRVVFIMGITAVAGFMAAICIHAKLKGSGNIIEGIKAIFEQDVLRRTAGGDMNEFAEVYWPSFNASVWETYSQYFHFSTEVITGIPGNLFPLLCVVPICIFGYEYKTRKMHIELLAMYVIFFLTSVSWFCLAKGHSYIHTVINYVLWYFGFVQICIYIIVNKVIEMHKVRK